MKCPVYNNIVLNVVKMFYMLDNFLIFAEDYESPF